MSLILICGSIFGSEDEMKGRLQMKETMVETKVSYTLEHAGKFFIIENVPARVCKETGEQFFAPETVEHIQSIIKGRRRPDRVIETPVYDYV
jgi:YgiT-type zinc finger domain-containing protein